VSKVFICYRREDSEGYSGRLYDRLRGHFGKEQVFRDIDRIPGGAKWAETVQRALTEAAAVVAVIGPRWMGGEEPGHRRIDDPKDPVRTEIEFALRQGISVAPVVLDSAKVPDEDQLPESLRPLVAVQALWLSERYFDLESGKIIDWIEAAVAGAPQLVEEAPSRNYWELEQRLVIPVPTEEEVFSVAFSPDGVTAAAAVGQGVLLLSRPDEPVRSWSEERPPEPRQLETAHENYVYAVRFSPDGSCLASADQNGMVQVTNLPTSQILWTDDTHTDAVYSIGFSPDGGELVSGGYDGLVQVQSTDGGDRIDSKRLAPCSSVAFSPVRGQRRVALGSLDNSVRLWDLETGSLSSVGPPHASSVEDVAFSCKGTLVASCGLDKAVRVWDLEAGEARVESRDAHGYLVRSIAFSPDGAWLASASWDKTIRIWNIEKKSQREIRWGHERHSDWIWCVAFSVDGSVLASGAADGKIIVWSLPEEM
jgi:WD40 repeat protein